MTEPETFISIPLSELRRWIRMLDEATAPKVFYTPDEKGMLKEAYAERGLAINTVANSIYTYLP